MSRVEVLERVRRITPLGIRFWDPVTDRQIVSGLHVTARPVGRSHSIVTAQTTRSGNYVFHHLPGLRRFEYAEKDLQYHQPPQDSKQYIIHLWDEEDRFLSTAFVVSAPHFGIYPGGIIPQSPPESSGFELFSMPVRRVPNGFAEVRADLWDPVRKQPASYALLEIQAESGRVYHGISDSDGKTAIFFPYPPVAVSLSHSPVSGMRTPLSEQSWMVRVRIRYAPSSVTGFAGIGEPNLKTVLGQPAGIAFPFSANTPETSPFVQEISFGKSTILRTGKMSTLLVSEQSSPP